MALWLTLRQCARLFNSHRKLWLPFLLVALTEAALIVLVWLAPHPPYSSLLAPPLRYVFGERALHYPEHLRLLYHMMHQTHVAATALAGAYFSGIASLMVGQAHQGRPLSLRNALVSGHARYGTLLLVWLVTWAVAGGMIEGVRHWRIAAAPTVWLSAGATVVVQALLVYPIPAAVFDRLSWWRALARGVQEFLRHPLSTLAIAALPSVLVIGFAWAFSEARVSRLMMQTEPEIVLACVAARLAVVTVADALLTIGAAHLWWFHRRPRA